MIKPYYMCYNKVMTGYIDNIQDQTLNNDNFRKVLYTGPKSQLVVMSLKPGEDIGMEVHEDVDQFFRIEQGTAKVIIDDSEEVVHDDYAVVVPAGSKHNVINIGDVDLKLYTIYTPPEHKDGTVHKTKEEAMADEHDHYEG